LAFTICERQKREIEMRTRGRLITLFAMTALASSRVVAQSDIPTTSLEVAPPEQAQAYEAALTEGPEALVSFMQAFPTSQLVPSVIRALAAAIGPQAAVQAALDAGVPTEVVLAVAAQVAPGALTITGQLTDPAASDSATTPY
jgi:hypothetical protein